MTPIDSRDPPWVVKVGGSLLDWPGLPARLGRYLHTHPAKGRLVLIVGGGPAADWVRALDTVHGLGDERAHHLALHSLDLSARAFAAISQGARPITMPDLEVVERLDDLDGAWRAEKTPILAPRRFLDDEDEHRDDPLPHTWAVTSDSIAARLAVRLGAAALALLKSAPLPPGTNRAAAARLGLVDPVFPHAAAPIPRVLYLNLRDPAGDPVVLAGAGE